MISSHLVTLTGSLPSARTPDPHLLSNQMSSVELERCFREDWSFAITKKFPSMPMGINFRKYEPSPWLWNFMNVNFNLRRGLCPALVSGHFKHWQHRLLFYCDSQCPASQWISHVPRHPGCWHLLRSCAETEGSMRGHTCVLCGPSDSALYSTVTIVTRLKNLKSEMNEAGLVWQCECVNYKPVLATVCWHLAISCCWSDW